MGLFKRRTPSERWHIDWDSPELQPIKGVSLQTYLQITSTPRSARPTGTWNAAEAAEAQQAGVPVEDWAEAKVGCAARVTEDAMVLRALQLIEDPSVRPRHNTSGI